MAHRPDYSSDSEFCKLRARQPDVDLTVAALELARDAYPDLDFDATLGWIDDRAGELAGPVARARTETDVLKELAHVIAEKYGISGDPEAYQLADGSYLPSVIETGRGIPISLSVLYMAVAERVGIKLEGVSAPMHYLLRYESADGPLFVDAFSGGRVLGQRQCVDWLRNLTQLPEQQIENSLRPASARTTIIRMLNNLKNLYALQENWQATWKVQHRLATLWPASYPQRRDLALISVKVERSDEAVDLLDSCLKDCPQNERETLKKHLELAQIQLARWN